MERQLLLLEAPAADWKLDEKTKELGLRREGRDPLLLGGVRVAPGGPPQRVQRAGRAPDRPDQQRDRDVGRHADRQQHHPHAA